jgi:hypothetical protein
MIGQDLPISQLPPANPLTGSELFVVVQDGVTKYTPFNNIFYSPIQGNTYGLFNQTGSSIPVTGSGNGTIVSGSLLDGGIGTLLVPANGFLKGDAFTAAASGIITSGNNHDFEVQIKSNNTVLVDTGVIELAQTTNKGWVLDINFSVQEIGPAGTARIITSGIFHYRTDSGGNVEGETFNFVNSSSFDTTINNTLIVEAVWGTDSLVTDSVYSNIFTLTKTF